MEKKYINELSREELIKVFDANEKLRHDIIGDMIETEMNYVSEQLDYVKDSLSDWEIGAYGHNYISIRNADDFIKGLNEMDNSIPAFSDDESKILKDAVKLRYKYHNTNMYSDEFNELEEQVEAMANKLGSMLVKTYKRIFDGCYNRENQIDYFISFYSHARLDEHSCYIVPERNDYVLFEDVTKAYN